jgi:hypothetical protein
VVDDLLINDDPHLLRFATTQTYVRVGDRWSYLAGHTAPNLYDRDARSVRPLGLGASLAAR